MLEYIYPRICFVCKTNPEAGDGLLCAACNDQLEPTQLGDWRADVTCSAGIDAAYSGWFFKGPLMNLIHTLKYSDCAKFGAVYGSKLGRLFEKEVKSQVDLITAVPLHSLKARERGYNQAEWLARGLSREWGKAVDFQLLKRVRATRTQTLLDASERQSNMRSAFRALKRVDGLRIAVVDDVLTTGSTISECAVVLKAAGASQVIAITCGTPQIEKLRNSEIC